MEKITKAQLQKLHVLLNQFGLIDEKANIIHSITNGRTKSSRELTKDEAGNLLSQLSKNDPADRMRGKIFALAYEAGIIWGESAEDKRMNSIKLRAFIKEKGTVKKELNRMTNTELVKVVSQFEQIVKHKAESQASKATKTLLNELNIQSSFRNTSKQF
ncbi:MAG: hypothetical protein ABI921_00190 [Panacibacter sp.]